MLLKVVVFFILYKILTRIICFYRFIIVFHCIVSVHHYVSRIEVYFVYILYNHNEKCFAHYLSLIWCVVYFIFSILCLLHRIVLYCLHFFRFVLHFIVLYCSIVLHCKAFRSSLEAVWKNVFVKLSNFWPDYNGKQWLQNFANKFLRNKFVFSIIYCETV